MIPKKHHCLFAVLMGNVYHLFGNFGNLPALECLEIFELPARHTVLVVVITLVNDVLRPEPVTGLLFKLL